MNANRRSRWKSLLTGTAKVTGRPTRAGRAIGLESTDAAVSNDRPQDEFAVNLNVDMGRLLAMTTAEEVIGYITGRDDSGQSVQTMPVSLTSPAIWLDFSRAMFDLPWRNEDVPLADFVCNLAHILKEGIDSGQVILDIPEFRVVENFRLVRIVWMKNLTAWYPQFEER